MSIAEVLIPQERLGFHDDTEMAFETFMNESAFASELDMAVRPEQEPVSTVADRELMADFAMDVYPAPTFQNHVLERLAAPEEVYGPDDQELVNYYLNQYYGYNSFSAGGMENSGYKLIDLDDDYYALIATNDSNNEVIEEEAPKAVEAAAETADPVPSDVWVYIPIPHAGSNNKSEAKVSGAPPATPRPRAPKVPKTPVTPSRKSPRNHASPAPRTPRAVSVAATSKGKGRNQGKTAHKLDADSDEMRTDADGFPSKAVKAEMMDVDDGLLLLPSISTSAAGPGGLSTPRRCSAYHSSPEMWREAIEGKTLVGGEWKCGVRRCAFKTSDSRERGTHKGLHKRMGPDVEILRA